MDRHVVLTDQEAVVVEQALLFAVALLAVNKAAAKSALAALHAATHQPEWLEEPGS